jgi:hypothetical protein
MDQEVHLPTPQHSRTHRVKQRLRDPRLSFAGFLSVVLVVAAILFMVGYLLYIHSSEYKLDITRPGFKGINNNELVQVNSDQTYDSTSPINRKALQDEQSSMNSRLQDLDHYGDFEDSSLVNTQNSLFSTPTSPEQ